MSLEEVILEIRDKVASIDAATQVIDTKLSTLQERQQQHSEEMHEAKDDIEELQKDVNQARGAVQLLFLISVVIGIAVGLSRLM